MFGPLIVKPGSSRKNKTGSWRMGLKPKFLQTNCIGCKMCVLNCPEACIEEEGKNIYKCNYDFCKGCGLCATVCPKEAIAMIKEDEKE